MEDLECCFDVCLVVRPDLFIEPNCLFVLSLAVSVVQGLGVSIGGILGNFDPLNKVPSNRARSSVKEGPL